MARQRGTSLVNTSSRIYFVRLQQRATGSLAARGDRQAVAVPYNIGMQATPISVVSLCWHRAGAPDVER